MTLAKTALSHLAFCSNTYRRRSAARSLAGMATDDLPIPEDDAAEQAATTDESDEPQAGPRPDVEADEADTLEQTQEVPEDDEYRDA